MFKRTDKYQLCDNTVSEFIDGNWVEIATFNRSKGQTLKPHHAALVFYIAIGGKG